MVYKVLYFSLKCVFSLFSSSSMMVTETGSMEVLTESLSQ